MAETKFLNLEGLTHFLTKLKGLFVQKELKTDSEDEYKVLSDNNFTDAYKQQLDQEKNFDGTYGSLTGKPAIDGTELDSTSTAEGLGLAKKTDLPKTATNETEGLVKADGTTIDIVEGAVTLKDADSYVKDTELPGVATAEKEGLVKPDDVTIGVDESGVISLKDAANYAKKTDLPTAATAEKAGIVKIGDNITLSEDGTGTISVTFPEGSDDILTKTQAETDYAKKTQVATDISTAKSEMQEAINTAVASAYKVKGSSTFLELPEPSEENLGDVYNISEEFTVDAENADKWVEGASGPYPKGTNVVVASVEEAYKWDVLAGLEDLSGYVETADLANYVQKTELTNYVKSTDLVAITNGEIDGLFTA